MKLYKKRIAFLISDQHLIAHGGIGQFAKGFTEMCQQLEWKVDIILDKAPTNKFSEVVESFGANLVYTPKSLSYSTHTSTFAFSDSMNFEKMINFRNAIIHAFTTNTYDMVVCNSLEAMPAIHALDIAKYIPVVFYTHEESMIFRGERKFKGVFTDSCNDFYNKMLSVNSIFVGTQCDRNVAELQKYDASNATKLSMPLPERGLLTANLGPREGVLYVGRWEDRKNPEAYLAVIKETGLPAKIMTNDRGRIKFEAKLAEYGITNYTIKAGIVGQEKVDFIKSCKVHFNPAKREVYPFSFFECLGHMPCVVLDIQNWSENFDSTRYTMTTSAEAAAAVTTAYTIDTAEHYASGALDYVTALDATSATQWLAFLNSFKAKNSNSNSAKINASHTVKYRQFITDLNRVNLAQEDIASVLGNKHKFTLVYTDDDSYLSKDANFVPEDVTADIVEQGVAGDEPTELAGSSLFVFG